jgi:hypothetical protein
MPAVLRDAAHFTDELLRRRVEARFSEAEGIDSLC